MKVLLKFTSQMNDEPHIADVILETGTRLNIVRATADAKGGEVLVDVPDDRYSTIARAFKSRGVNVHALQHPVVLDENACVRCGACISVCPVNVFRFEKDWSVALDENKCVQCGICVTACPLCALDLSL